MSRAVSISEQDFIFVGQSFEHRCTKFEAAFLSPRVYSELLKDPTVNSVFLETEKRIFDVFVSLLKGARMKLEAGDRKAFLRLAVFLENREVLEQFFGRRWA
jgi:hypothetical protein